MPLAQGFDESFGHMGGCIDNYSHFFYWNGPNRHDLWHNGIEVWRAGEYFPDLMVEQAKDFINRNNEEPFFMYFALNNPHYPLQPDPKWQSHYKDLPQPRRDYAAFVSTMDERIGALLKHLEEVGLRENTIIIFQSDHGHSVEERAFGGGGSAGPYRGAKFSLFEGGIRVPAIISWPGQIPKGESRNQMAFNIDWMSTIASLCGLRLPVTQGKDLSNVIQDSEAKSPHELFRWKSGVSWAIRKGDWKLIGLPKDPVNPNSLDPEKDRLFLSNIQQDVSESENLAFQNPGKVEELLADYLKWPHASPEDVPQERQRIKNKAFGKSIALSHPPHPNYSQGGSAALIDEQSGSRSFSDGYWLGFESEDLEAVIDLGSVMPTTTVSIGVLEDPSTWIFFPDFVEISFSLDGKSYTQPIRLGDVGRKESRKVSMKRMQLDSENMDIRFIKVFAKNIGECPTWHQAAGSKAWLFVDEITVE